MHHLDARLLIIDDEPDMRDLLAFELSQEGFQVTTADNGYSGVAIAQCRKFDLAIADLRMPGMDGVETVAALKALDPSMEVIVATGFASPETAIACMKQGAYDYIQKPYDLDDLRHLLDKALEKSRLQAAIALYEKSSSLVPMREHANLIPNALELALQILTADAIALTIKWPDNADPEFHRHAALEQPSERLLGRLAQQVSDSPTPRLFTTEADPEAGRSGGELLAAEGFAHALAFPLRLRNNATGALLFLRTSASPPFTMAGRQSGQLLADRLTPILDNSRLYQELTHAEQQARASEMTVRALFNAAYSGLVLFDRTLLIQDINPAAEQIFGYGPDEAYGQTVMMLFSPHERGRLLSILDELSEDQPRHSSVEFTARRRSGEDFTSELSLAILETPAGLTYAAFFRDLSEKKRLEMELRHAQKLEAVGRLAAGIAHEINSPIQFVGDSTRFLQTAFEELKGLIASYRALLASAHGLPMPEIQQAEEEADLEFLLEQIPKAIDRTQEGVSRVASIVRAMKEFAYPDRPEKAAADLNKALLSTLAIARNELKYCADVETELGELPPVHCHIGDLNQVFLNLLVNAAHAIEDAGSERGIIAVRTWTEDRAVFVAIRDTGCGIPEAIRDKIFDPFFTSKEVGRGTGQGLAIARNIVVDRHGGSLSCETAVGRGTTFFIRLPVDGGEGAA